MVTSNRCHTDAYSSDFVTGLPISVDWRGNSHDPILVIVDRLKMMVHYKLVQITTNARKLAEVISDVFHVTAPIILMLLPSIKQSFPQTDGQTERQNSTIEAYLRAFINDSLPYQLHAFQVELRLQSMRFMEKTTRNTSTVDYTLSGHRVLEGRQLACNPTQHGSVSFYSPA